MKYKGFIIKAYYNPDWKQDKIAPGIYHEERHSAKNLEYYEIFDPMENMKRHSAEKTLALAKKSVDDLLQVLDMKSNSQKEWDKLEKQDVARLAVKNVIKYKEGDSVPDTYCHLYRNNTGEAWILELGNKQTLNAEFHCKKMINKVLLTPDKVRIETSTPDIGGDFSATIYTDGRPPNNGVCWSSCCAFITVK